MSYLTALSSLSIVCPEEELQEDVSDQVAAIVAGLPNLSALSLELTWVRASADRQIDCYIPRFDAQPSLCTCLLYVPIFALKRI